MIFTPLIESKSYNPWPEYHCKEVNVIIFSTMYSSQRLWDLESVANKFEST